MADGNGQTESKQSFFSFILDFILGRSSNPQRKALKEAQKQLNKAGYRFYNLNHEKVLPSFANELYDIYAAIGQLREFFLSQNDNKYYANACLTHFMDEKILKICSLLEKDSLNKRGKAIEFNQLKTDTNNQFETLRKVFSAEVADKVNAMYNAVIVLKDFCTLDYYALLRQFAPNLEENNFQLRMTFLSVDKKYVEEFISDFLTAASKLLVVADWSDVITFLSALPGYRQIDMNRYLAMYDSLLTMNTLRVLTNFGKLVFNNIEYVLPSEFPAENIVSAYLDNFKQTLDENLEEINIQKKTEKLESQMQMVFGTDIISELQNYTVDASARLAEVQTEEEDCIHYSKCEQVRFFHALADCYLRKELMDFVKIFTVRAQIDGNDYSADFSAMYHQMLEADEEIMRLDMQLGMGFPTGYKLSTLLNMAHKLSDAADKLKEEVDAVNKQFEQQLAEGMGKLHAILAKIKELLVDIKSLSPAIVKNWGNMDDFLHEPALKTLSTADSKLSSFIALMDCYK